MSREFGNKYPMGILRRGTMRKWILGAFLALFVSSMPVFGQATDANLVGIVADASGAGVPNADVEVTNNATGVKSIAKTETSGTYRFNNLPAGTYDLRASAMGFATAAMRGLELQLNKNTTANVTLQVASVSSTVEIAAASTTIDTTTAHLQTTFESSQIVNLPIIENSNGFFGALNLSLLSAGVTSNGGVGQGTGPSVGGQRPVANNYMIEDIDNNNKVITGPLVIPLLLLSMPSIM